jgi:WD40 repeat protein
VARGQIVDAVTSKYRAFISYSHAVDSQFAPALQSGLHRFAKPWYQLRALRVFRDQTNLTASPALWPSIERALSESECFLLLASPESAASKWVQREVDHWAEHRDRDRFLIALTDGDIAWNAQSGDFDWDATTAVPEVLHGRFANEPLYVDFRWARTEEHLSLRDPRFREGIADIAAAIAGRDKDELIGEDIHQHKVTMRLVRVVIAALVILLLVAVGSAFVAIKQRDRAEEERNLATSRQLAAQAVNERGHRLDQSLLLALEGLGTSDTVEARSALLGGLEVQPQLVRFLQGSGEASSAVAFDPDGARLAAGTGEDIRIFDVASGRPVARLVGDGAAVVSLSFAQAGSELVAVDRSGIVSTWSSDGSGWHADREDVGVSTEEAAVSPDGSLVALTGVGREPIVWDVAAGSIVARPVLPSPHAATSAAFSPDGSMVAFGSYLGLIKLWDLSEGRWLRQHIEIPIGDFSQAVRTLAFSPDGDELASGGGGGGGVGLWRVSDGTSIGGLSVGDVAGATAPVTALAYSPSGSTLITADADGLIRTWSLYTDQPSGDPYPSQGVAGDLGFSPDGSLFASGSDEGVIVLWDPSRTQRLGTSLSSGQNEVVSDVQFDSSGDVLASAVFGQVDLWNVSTGEQTGRPLTLGDPGFGPVVYAIAVDPRDDTLAAGTSDGTIESWDLGSRARDHTPIHVRDGVINDLAYAPDGSILAVAAEGGSVSLWDVGSGDRRATYPADHDTPVNAVAFSPDGTVLASAREDGKIVLWNVETGEMLGSPLPAHDGSANSVAFSPDGTLLASAGDEGNVLLWNVASRTHGEPLVAHDGSVSALAFSPDRSILASAADGVTLWDVVDRRRLGSPLVGATQGVTTLDFSPDGTLAWGTIAIAPTDDMIVTWTADLAGWERTACSLAHRELAPDEWTQLSGGGIEYQPVCSG